MAEAALAEAPAAAAPAAQPAATPAPTGIKAAMADFAETTTPAALANPAATPAAKPGETPAAKPGEAHAKPAAAEKPADIWAKAPTNLKNAHFQFQRETTDKITKAEARIKELESKPQTPADTKAIEAYQKQIDAYEQRLAAADFRQSKDYQTQFVDRWNGEYKAAVAEVSRLQVKVVGADGAETQRAATQADLDKIMRLPPGDQDRAINELFGPYANRVFSRLFRMQEIEQSADRAVEEHSKQSATKAAEAQTKSQQEQQEYEKLLTSSHEELAKEWPDHFAPDEKDAEATAALQKGMDFVDKALKDSAAMTPQDRAAYNAVIRARAAAFPRAVLNVNRLKAEVASLKTELSKFRKSDPGGEVETPGQAAPQGEEVPSGIKAAAGTFKGM